MATAHPPVPVRALSRASLPAPCPKKRVRWRALSAPQRSRAEGSIAKNEPPLKPVPVAEWERRALAASAQHHRAPRMKKMVVGCVRALDEMSARVLRSETESPRAAPEAQGRDEQRDEQAQLQATPALASLEERRPCPARSPASRTAQLAQALGAELSAKAWRAQQGVNAPVVEPLDCLPCPQARVPGPPGACPPNEAPRPELAPEQKGEPEPARRGRADAEPLGEHARPSPREDPSAAPERLSATGLEALLKALPARLGAEQEQAPKASRPDVRRSPEKLTRARRTPRPARARSQPKPSCAAPRSAGAPHASGSENAHPRLKDSKVMTRDSMATICPSASNGAPCHSAGQASSRFQRITSVTPSTPTIRTETFLRWG